MTDELETQAGDDDQGHVAQSEPVEPEGAFAPTEPLEASAPEVADEPVPEAADDSTHDDASSDAEEPSDSATEEASEDPRATLEERIPQIEIADSAQVADEDASGEEEADGDATEEEAPARDAPKVPWWPFLVLLATWLGVVAGAFFTLSYEATADPLVQQEAYAYVILAGLVLAILGPLLALVVWFVVWRRAGKGHRDGLLTVSLVRGAGVTFLGVLAWWGAIVALDALRLGLIG